jgi:hypothetical protein
MATESKVTMKWLKQNLNQLVKWREQADQTSSIKRKEGKEEGGASLCVVFVH